MKEPQNLRKIVKRWMPKSFHIWQIWSIFIYTLKWRIVKSWTRFESIRLCRARPRHFITAWPVKWDEKPVKWLHTQHLRLLSDSSRPRAYFSISEKVRGKHLQVVKCSELQKDKIRIEIWPTSDFYTGLCDFFRLLLYPFVLYLSDPGKPGVRYLGLDVTTSETLLRLYGCDSGWWR